jgi:ABC-type branched-subunit amino acid transport system substrate-binding protein
MRIKSRWLAILLAMGLVLAACSPAGTEATTTTEGGAPTTSEGGGTTTTGETPAEIQTDVGVDLESGTINIGLLSDLSGQFSSLVQLIVAAHEIYWADVNANGGINGLMVDVTALDTEYLSDVHVQRYEELQDEVVAFGHSTGSPQTVAILDQLEADGILAIPLTWYSGWSDPVYGSNLLHHGTSYCLESMNVISFIKEQLGAEATTIAIASVPGDYGLDSMEGAKIAADQLGLEIVYDGSGQIIPGDEASFAAVTQGIVGSDPDIVYMTSSPLQWGPIFGGALAAGFTTAHWSGAGPSYNPAFIRPDSAIKDAVGAMTTWGTYYSVWSDDAPGVTAAKDLLLAAGQVVPGDAEKPPVSAYLEGFVEAQMMHAALEAAYAAGDLTQAGVLAAAKSLENVAFEGLGPDESFVGAPDEQVQRSTTIWRPDPAALVAGIADASSAGEVVVEADYVADITASYEFTQACYAIER